MQGFISQCYQQSDDCTTVVFEVRCLSCVPVLTRVAAFVHQQYVDADAGQATDVTVELACRLDAGGHGSRHVGPFCTSRCCCVGVWQGRAVITGVVHQ